MRLSGGIPFRAEWGLSVLYLCGQGCMARVRSAEAGKAVEWPPSNRTGGLMDGLLLLDELTR